MPSISIIVPAYNEERRLPSSLEAISTYIASRPNLEFEVLVVDDGSRDGTAALVEEYARQHPYVRVVRNPGNRGKGYSVRHGMGEARGDWRLFTDADLSAPIEELDKLYAAVLQTKADVAIGSRALDPALVGVHQPFLREQAGRAFNVAMRVITALPFHDTQCGFKLYSAPAADAIFPRQQLDGFGFDVEDLYIAKMLGFTVREIPVRWNNVEGTKVSLLHGVDSFLDPFRIRWNQIRGKYGR